METEWQQLLTSLGGFGSRKMGEIGIFPFIGVMGISLFCSLYVSFLYTKFYRTRATGSQVHRAFPLLGISITAIFICIQFSLPLSLGLLGALSIVRFRTPIKEPEEIGFIMLVVANSICCATFNLVFLAIILAVSVLALLALRVSQGVFKGSLNDGMLIISMPAGEYRDKSDRLLTFLEAQLPKGRLDSISESHDESIVTYSFLKLKTDALLALQRELKGISDSAKSNVYFNRPGEL